MRLAFLLLTAAVAFAADDPWTKVKDLKSGTEIRVIKKGSVQPILGKFDEANDENLILVVKNEQTAIPRDAIDRLDFRPEKPRVVKETTTKSDADGPPKEPPIGMNHQQVGPGYSSNTSYSIQGKGDFETLYRRPAPASKKK